MKPKRTRSSRYRLLSVEDDAKTIKGTEYGVLTAICFLAPAKEADGIHTMCGASTPHCEHACIYETGHGMLPSTKAARIRRTLLYLQHPDEFYSGLDADLYQLTREAAARGLEPACRPNGTSDQPQLARRLARRHPSIQFYDYTKIRKPWLRVLPNYHLTFSYSGENLSDCMAALKHGINVAVVFSGPLPASWHGYRVIDGDLSDLRFRDPKGVIVGLRPKGYKWRDLPSGGSNFIQIDTAESTNVLRIA